MCDSADLPLALIMEEILEWEKPEDKADGKDSKEEATS